MLYPDVHLHFLKVGSATHIYNFYPLHLFRRTRFSEHYDTHQDMRFSEHYNTHRYGFWTPLLFEVEKYSYFDRYRLVLQFTTAIEKINVFFL